MREESGAGCQHISQTVLAPPLPSAAGLARGRRASLPARPPAAALDQRLRPAPGSDRRQRSLHTTLPRPLPPCPFGFTVPGGMLSLCPSFGDGAIVRIAGGTEFVSGTHRQDEVTTAPPSAAFPSSSHRPSSSKLQIREIDRFSLDRSRHWAALRGGGERVNCAGNGRQVARRTSNGRLSNEGSFGPLVPSGGCLLFDNRVRCATHCRVPSRLHSRCPSSPR